MTSENYINLYDDDEKNRLTVLTNICRMMIRRGHMSKQKYLMTSESFDENTSVVPAPASDSDDIDNKLFLPFFDKKTDNNVYTIRLDINIKDDRIDEGNKKGNSNKKSLTSDSEKYDFDGSLLIIKLVPQRVSDIENSPLFNDFVKTYIKNHKIIVFDGILEKVYNSVRHKKNIEVFSRDALKIDLMSYILSPLECNIVTSNDIKHIIHPKIPKIHENDPLARYYRAKKGQIIRIIRASINNSKEVVYRKVIEPKPIFNV